MDVTSTSALRCFDALEQQGELSFPSDKFRRLVGRRVLIANFDLVAPARNAKLRAGRWFEFELLTRE